MMNLKQKQFHNKWSSGVSHKDPEDLFLPDNHVF